MPDLSEARILFIATDGFEDSELLDPLKALKERGAEVTLASIETEEIEGDKGYRIRPDLAMRDVDSKDFDALLLPGGTKSPDRLRMDEQVVYTVRKFVDAGKPVAAICHGPW
ncbi:MAG TPA: DJ-1/PfpI family protein, partial [Allosphingosinicella sp.]|nr:DJ-1/PfpI family protein [Allosphingosinicella sp.]